VGVVCESAADSLLIRSFVDDECWRLTSPFKAQEEPSGLPSWISLQPSGG
jgi:hypothetical protein